MSLIYPDFYEGFYEIKWFHTQHFNVMVNSQNRDTFQFVKLYQNEMVPGSNFEHLFLTYDIYTKNP